MALLGIQEPRHVFTPPAGKYTFNATESAGAGGVHRIHDHFKWFTLKRRGCEGLKRRCSESAYGDCTSYMKTNLQYQVSDSCRYCRIIILKDEKLAKGCVLPLFPMVFLPDLEASHTPVSRPFGI